MMSTSAAPQPGTPEWVEEHRRWLHRPIGRAATPGHLCGPQRAGEYPAGGHPQCRRCTAPCSLEGHPYGCPRTPKETAENGRLSFEPWRPCYCGQSMIFTPPDRFGPCCENTPPVRVPGGCRWCGSDLCQVNDPEDLPDDSYHAMETPERHEGFGKWWVHARCVDEWLLGRGREDLVAPRRQEREIVLGEDGPRMRRVFG